MKKRNDSELADTLLSEALTATRQVLADKTAPPTAKASAVSSAIAIHKLLKERRAGDIPPAEMTAAELQEAIAEANARLVASGEEGLALDGEDLFD